MTVIPVLATSWPLVLALLLAFGSPVADATYVCVSSVDAAKYVTATSVSPIGTLALTYDSGQHKATQLGYNTDTSTSNGNTNFASSCFTVDRMSDVPGITFNNVGACAIGFRRPPYAGGSVLQERQVYWSSSTATNSGAFTTADRNIGSDGGTYIKEFCNFPDMATLLSNPGCYYKPEKRDCLPGYTMGQIGNLNIAKTFETNWNTDKPMAIANDGSSFQVCCSETGVTDSCSPPATCYNGGTPQCSNRWGGSTSCTCPSSFNYDANCLAGCGDGVLQTNYNGKFETCEAGGSSSYLCANCIFSLDRYTGPLDSPVARFTTFLSAQSSLITVFFDPVGVEPTLKMSPISSFVVTVFDSTNTVVGTPMTYAVTTAAGAPVSFVTSITLAPLSSFTLQVSIQWPHNAASIFKTSITSLCRCAISGPDGSPTDFAVVQSGTSIYFQWVDGSTCEDRFNIYRGLIEGDPDVPNPDPVFITSFAFRAKQVCGTNYAPTTAPDLINELTLGATYQYCIEAATSVPSEFASPRSCVSHTIAFTSRLEFSVSTKSSSPVRDIPITVSYKGQLFASLVTGRDGKASTVLTIDGVTDSVIDLDIVLLTPSGASAPHSYLIYGVVTNTTSVQASHLGFNAFEFFDISVVAVSGQVIIANSAPFTGLFGADGPPCPQADPATQVCAFDDSDGTQIQCVSVITDSLVGKLGSYLLNVPLGMSARISTALTVGTRVHTFSPAVSKIVSASADVTHLDFADTTTDALFITAVASRCSLYMGPTVFTATLAKTCPNYKRDLHGGSEAGQIMSTFLLPSSFFEIRFKQIDDMPPQSNNRFPPDSISPLNVGAYFATVGEDVVESDLSAGPTAIRFEYRVPPVLSIGSGSGVLVDSGACADTPIRVVKKFNIFNATINIVEDFGDAGTCANITGSLRLFDEVSVITAPCSAQGATGYCNQDLILPTANAPGGIQKGVSYSKFLIRPGDPNIVRPNILNLRFAFTLKPGMTQSLLTVPYIVEGSRARGQPYTFRSPAYLPSLIVHDPPGDGSFASWTKDTTFATTVSMTTGLSMAATFAAETSAGLEQEKDVCVGLGASTCEEILKVKSGVTVSETVSASMDTNVDGSMTIAYTSSQTYSTSGDEGGTLPGMYSDMFIVPILTIKYSVADIVTFNETKCAAEVTSSAVWEPTNGAANSVLFQSYDDVVNLIVPELVKLKMITPTSDLTKQLLLKNALDGWTKVLNRQDFAYLSAIPLGVPSIGAAGDVTGINSFTFGGGGATLDVSSTSSKSASMSAGFSVVVSNEFATEIEMEAELLGVSVGSKNSFALSMSLTVGVSTTTDSSTDTTTAYSLSDNDPGDFFNVGLYTDIFYGTPLFKIISGASSCPYEGYLGDDAIQLAKTYTIKRETFTMLFRSANLIENLPANGVAIWSLEVQNLTPFQEPLYLLLGYDSVTNPDNLRISTGGLPLGSGGQALTLTVPYVDAASTDSEAYSITIEGRRGPIAWLYDDIGIDLFSQCEFSIDPLKGAEGLLTSTAVVAAHFLQPCAPINWAGDLNLAGSWIVNTLPSATPNQLSGYISNSQYSINRWDTHPRVQTVTIQYKTPVDLVWTNARDSDGNVLEVKASEDPFGYAAFTWDLNAFPDATYDIRGIVSCVPSPAGGDFDQSITAPLRGIVDRKPPAQFGAPEPADGIWFPGDRMGFSFDEPILCDQPYVFQVVLQVNLVNYGRDVPIICSGNTINLDLLNSGVSMASLGGALVTIAVTGIRDLAGNAAENTFQYTFSVYNVDSVATVASVAPINLKVAYTTFIQAQQTNINALLKELGDAAQAAFPSANTKFINRLAVSSLTRAIDGTTNLGIYISAGPQPTADVLAANVRKTLGFAVSTVQSAAERGAVLRHVGAKTTQLHVTQQSRSLATGLAASAIHILASTSMLSLVNTDTVAVVALVPPTSDFVSAATQTVNSSRTAVQSSLITAENSTLVIAAPATKRSAFKLSSATVVALIVGAGMLVAIAMLAVALVVMFRRVVALSRQHGHQYSPQINQQSHSHSHSQSDDDDAVDDAAVELGPQSSASSGASHSRSSNSGTVTECRSLSSNSGPNSGECNSASSAASSA